MTSKTLCSVMNISHTFSTTVYSAFLQNVLVASKSVFEINQMKAVKEEIRENTSAGNNPLNLSVSGDGSWKKRGFSSLFGLTTLIGKFTGKIVDVVVKSSFCQACATWKSKEGTPEYLAWRTQHEDQCTAKHTGSAGKMEVDAVKEMFQRSEEKLGVRYENYIGDGDTKTFKAILDLQSYDDLEVKKKECVWHVQKRMGTRLRKIKKDTKGLGGKGTGTLTDKLITNLTLYYGLAIRRHLDSAKKMREAVWATFYHKISTDDNPQHQFCPQGPESWCKWRIAEAEGTLSNFKHDPPLKKKVQDAIKPVYEALSDKDLLQRCTGGNTQNSNESLNSMVWKIAPKHLHCGQQTVEIATYIAANVFNEGWSSVLNIMNTLGIPVGLTAYNYAETVNQTRINKAEQRMSSAVRAAIIANRVQRIQENKGYEEEGLLYAAGIAD